MNRYALSHLSDQALLRELRTLVAQDRATTALLVAHLGEVDARRLYAEAGYPSMFAYCVERLGFSEESAYKRIRVARVAREFPAIHGMLADGRLHLSAVVVLASCLTPGNVDDLLAAATHRSRAAVEQLLAERFPRPDLPSVIQPLPGAWSAQQPSAGTLDATGHPLTEASVQCVSTLLSPGTVEFSPTELLASAPGESPAGSLPPPVARAHQVAPLAPQRFAVQFTMDQEAHDDLIYAQALLGHAVPSGDPAAVFARALKALVAQLEKRKFAKTDRPCRCHASDDPRHVPADVKRAVWERDGGRCTFVSAAGHRCEARTRLEYDHVEPVADGGQGTVRGLRLRCRAHNQYEAERHFGRDFMEARRERAHEAAQAVRREVAQRERGGTRELAPHEAELLPWLRTLGLRAEEARRVAERCGAPPDAPLEERLRHALKCYGGPRTVVTRTAA